MILRDALFFIKKRPCVSFGIALTTLAPLVLYFYKFHNGLSSNESSWAVFGTYVGGVYDPLFTFVSVIVLVETLLEISRSNRKAFNLALSNNTLTEIIKLTEILDSSIQKNKMIKEGQDRAYAFEWLGKAVKDQSRICPPINEDEVLDASLTRFKDDDIQLFRDEMYILQEIITRIVSIEDDELKESAFAVFRAIIPNRERYWLECYAKRFKPEIAILFRLWTPAFCITPSDLLELIERPEDVCIPDVSQ